MKPSPFPGQSSRPLRFEDLDPSIQAKVQARSGPFAAGQDLARRYDAAGNYAGDVFYESDGTAVLHPPGDAAPIRLDSEQGVDFSGMTQDELRTHTSPSTLPDSALPASALPAGTLVDSSALPASAVPRGYTRGDAIPAEMFPPGQALPAAAIPAEALPAAAIPSNTPGAIPSNTPGAIPAEAASGAIPAEAASGAIPAEAASGAIPSNAHDGIYNLVDEVALVNPEGIPDPGSVPQWDGVDRVALTGDALAGEVVPPGSYQSALGGLAAEMGRRALAEAIGVSTSTIGRIIRGESVSSATQDKLDTYWSESGIRVIPGRPY